jgi:membrane-anchored protein YejM (alkaline phosphatase superfamily)
LTLVNYIDVIVYATSKNADYREIQLMRERKLVLLYPNTGISFLSPHDLPVKRQVSNQAMEKTTIIRRKME